MRFEGNLYRCNCDAGELHGETCPTCKGYGLLYAGRDGPQKLTDIDTAPLLVFMATRLAALERDHEKLVHENAKLMSASEERTQSEQEFLDSMHQQNRMLRGEVRALAKSMGLRPASVEGEPWVPRRGERDGVLGQPSEEGPVEAVRQMVKHHIEEAIEDTTPESIRQYVDKIVGHNVEMLVKRHLGIDTFRHVKEGPLKKAIEEAIDQYIDLTSMVKDAMEGMDLPSEVPEYIKEEAGDEFRVTLRHKMRNMAHELASDLAGSALRETIETAVLDELPWLKRYLATKRLGGGNRE